MAQLSKGIRVGYAPKLNGNRPTDWVFLSDLTGIPALSGAPASHQVTTLMDSAHTYVMGLLDSGGNLDFPCIFTSKVISETGQAVALQSTSILEWVVEFPYPLGKRYYFEGEVTPVYNESVDVDAPVTGTVSLVPNVVVQSEDAEYEIEYDTQGGSAVATTTYKYGQALVEPEEPTRDSDEFLGWSYDDNGDVMVAFGKDTVMGNEKLYAIWE